MPHSHFWFLKQGIVGVGEEEDQSRWYLANGQFHHRFQKELLEAMGLYLCWFHSYLETLVGTANNANLLTHNPHAWVPTLGYVTPSMRILNQNLSILGHFELRF